eukprot:g4635.t1
MKKSVSSKAFEPLPEWAKKVPKGAAKAAAGSPSKGSPKKRIVKSSSASDLNRFNLPEHWKTKEQLSQEAGVVKKKRLPAKPKIRPFPRKDTQDTGPANDSDEPAEDAGPAMDSAGGDALVAPAKEDVDYLTVDMSALPIEDFDDSTFETRTPAEWLALSKNGQAPLYIDGDWKWMACEVDAYDEVRGRYHITFRINQMHKWVKRLNLKFDEEEEGVFRARLAASGEARKDAVRRLRFDHFLKRVPDKSVNRITEQVLESIGERVGADLVSATIQAARQAAEVAKEMNQQIGPSLISRLVTEIEALHTRAVKKGVALHRLPREEAMASRFTRLGLTIPGPPPPAQEFGMVAVPLVTPFEESSYQVHQGLAWLRYEGAAPTIKWLYETFEEHFDGNPMVCTEFGEIELPMEVADFAALQKTYCEKYLVALQGWKFRRGLLDKLMDDVKGYDFFESDPKRYAESECYNFLKLVELHMTECLRRITKQTIDAWLEMLRMYDPLHIDDPSSPTDIKSALFSMKLEDSTSGEEEPVVEFAARISEVEECLQTALFNAEQTLKEITAVDRDILTVMQIDERKCLPLGECDEDGLKVCEELDARFAEASEQITRFVERAFEAPRATAKKYHEFLGELHVQPEDFVDRVMYLSNDEVQAASAAAAKAAAAAKEASKATDASAGEKKAEDEDGEDEDAHEDEEDSAEEDDEGEEGAARTQRPLEGIIKALQDGHDRIQSINYVTHNTEYFPMVHLDCTGLKKTLVSQNQHLLLKLQEFIVEDVRERNNNITERYKAILERVSKTPKDEEELVALAKFVEESEVSVQGLQAEVSECFDRLDTLGINKSRLPWGHFRLAWSTKEWPKKLHNAIEKTQQEIEANRQQMLDKLDRDKESFERDLENIQEMVKAVSQYDDLDRLQQIYDEVSDIEQKLVNAHAHSERFNQREAAFNLTETEYTAITKIEREFEPFSKLWTMTYDFRSNKDNWVNGPFHELDANQVSKDVNSWWTSSYKLNKQLADAAPGAAEVAAKLRAETTDFKKNVPLIEALGSPALRDRHWQQLSKLIEHELINDDELTLQAMVELDIMQHFDKIEEVTVVANKEFNLQKNLQAMQDEWTETAFVCVAYKETGTFVVGGTDDIIMLLDDQIVKAQTMLSSPYIKPVKKECKEFERKLTYVQSLVDEWLAVQRGWMYLEPIFSSPDIMRQMPTEGRRFASVDGLWRQTLQRTQEEPLVMTVAENDKLLGAMKAASEKLDIIQKGLNDYLETKALVFPRFFFLSNDELLEILSQTKDPRAVQPYLGKCFEGIGKIVFAGEGKDKDAPHVEADDVLMEMASAEGEQVPLISAVDPNQGKKKGNVEIWLLELERAMRLTVKDIVGKAMAAYKKTERKQWVQEWAAQIILCVGGLYWTTEVESALKASGLEGLKAYFANLNDQLMDIVNLVRGKLPKLTRKALGALTVVDVHQKDVVEDMVKKEVTSVDDFEWMSQLRYYWQEKPDDYNRYGDDPYNLLARIINAEQMYGYEYLGCSSRLIITPLTDRCYRTLMGAVSLMYGGAPAGPAGTGKTETTKDLAKAVAIQCVVMNCSDGLDYLAMAKFFKGLAQSGAWACFDEFNRIELEVLSVIAQQILTIQKAKRQRAARFVFEGTNLSLNPDCNVFITMNPGYAGRSELPDNLQALFRPCAMMVPDYAMIAEIKLYSFGFTNGLKLARKLTQVLKLSSELLSTQKHYDYGMRAVFSILVRAGALRQDLGDKWSEEWIVFSAILDVNLPKFTSEDLPLFRGITTDLFPGVTLPSPEYGELIPEIKRQCVAQKLQPKDKFVEAVVQLFETVQVRHGLMVVGLTMSGKSGVFNSLARAMTKLDEYENVKRHIMNPKGITQGQLYGNFDPNTHEWSDGILAVLYRLAAKDSVNRNWVLFDGPVDAVWIENMNTVLDDNKKLCLVSGEIIKMSPTMTMMFETEDLEEASPATVSRVGMVYMQPARLGAAPLVDSWIQFR